MFRQERGAGLGVQRAGAAMFLGGRRPVRQQAMEQIQKVFQGKWFGKHGVKTAFRSLTAMLLSSISSSFSPFSALFSWAENFLPGRADQTAEGLVRNGTPFVPWPRPGWRGLLHDWQ